MDNVSITEIGYLLFVIPGFVFVWTYRHFSNSKIKIGEFEYAAWSFVWGFVLLAALLWIMGVTGASWPDTPINDVASFLGALLGIGLGQTIGAAFPLGYIAAILQRWGFFAAIDNSLKWGISLITRGR